MNRHSSAPRSRTANRPGACWLAFLLALLGLLCPAGLASADGLVLYAVGPREAGMQVDAAAFSPATGGDLSPTLSAYPAARAVAPGTVTSAQTYVVQPGDTLSGIAARLGLDPALLAARNALSNPDHIEVGQVLRLGEPPTARLRLPADGELTRVQMWPWPPVQGQTLAVWLEARSSVPFSLRLGEVSYPVVSQGRRGWALVPLPALMSPGTVALTVAAGQTTVILPVGVEAGTFGRYNVPAEVSSPILSQVEKVRQEATRLQTLFAGASPFGWTPRSRFREPLTGAYPRTSPYGTRRTYGNSPVVSAHEGEDFSASPGTRVSAPAPGIVVLAEPLFVRGNAVIVDHGHGVFTGYWHLEEIAVRVGDAVEAGDLLGTVGSTGLSTGAHLHWEMRVNGIAVDPLQWVEK